jgi:prepilin-type processing-associated H-X9-DG protein
MPPKTQTFRHPRRSPAGVTLAEVIVVIVIVGMGVLVLLTMLPHGREQARLLACGKNLGQIGVALALYDQGHQRLPSIALPGPLDAPAGSSGPGPLRTLLEALELPDLTGLHDPKSPPPGPAGPVPGEMPVPGFICASDPNATAGWFTAPVSYRATTGDTPAGDNGPFAIGRVLRLQAVESGDGLSYTSAFSERLVGDHEPNHAGACNYQVVPGPLAGAGCPATDDGPRWRGDAGSSWFYAGYRSTLYNHALPPGAQPSCVAEDGQTAFMGASSGHGRGVNLLLLDGSVTLVTREIDPRVWKRYATVNARE